jgi:beta-lactamase class A
MHAHERAGKAREQRLQGRSTSRSSWLVTAAVVLGAAVAYFAVTLVEAFDNAGSPLSVDVADSIKVIPIPQDSYAVPPPAQAAEDDASPPAELAAPIPGLPEAVGDPALLATIEEAVGDDDEHIAISVKRVSDGRAASFNGAFQFYAASTFKLAVLYEAELRHFRGELKYDDTIFMSEEDAAEDLGTSGSLEFEEDGSIMIQNLLEAMITVSDNSSAVALMHEFGSGNIDRTIRDLGLETMTLNQVELWTTADDLARLMEAIYVGEGVGVEERDHMRELLLGQSIRAGIPAAVSEPGVLIGNKTGTWPGAQHDVAFVEAQTGAYVISILTDGSFEGWQALHRVARDVHEKFSQTP